MSTQQPGSDPDLQAMVDELVRTHTHSEPYIIRGLIHSRIGHHRARVPALIDQLLDPDPPASGEMSGSAPQSRPAARVEAIDTIGLISREAGAWIVQLGARVPGDVIDPGRTHQALRGTGAKRALVILRSLHAGLTGDDACGREHGRKVTLEPETDSEDSLLGTDSKDSHLARRVWCCTAHHVEADVRYWWRQARIIAGWDSPPYRPYATCPVCETRGGLRINLTTHTAVCVECRTVWDPSTIGLLGEHVRTEREGRAADDTADDTPVGA